MGYKQDALICNALGNRWAATSAPAAGTTCVANGPTITNARQLQNLSTLTGTVLNRTAAAVTYTLSVRDASIAGTVLASMDFQVASAGNQFQNILLDLPGVTGNALWAEFGTPNASVVQKLTITGWTEEGR